jgi:hypothetical protein
MTAKSKTPARPLNEIAMEIFLNWRKSVSGTELSPYAKPYLEAMSTLNSIDDNYILDSGKSIVAYFLGNATSWKGDTARRIKKELNAMLKAR